MDLIHIFADKARIIRCPCDFCVRSDHLRACNKFCLSTKYRAKRVTLDLLISYRSVSYFVESHLLAMHVTSQVVLWLLSISEKYFEDIRSGKPRLQGDISWASRRSSQSLQIWDFRRMVSIHTVVGQRVQPILIYTLCYDCLPRHMRSIVVTTLLRVRVPHLPAICIPKYKLLRTQAV